MSSTLTISIPERYWRPIKEAPRDGTIMFIRNAEGVVDITCWDKGEWWSELGMGLGDDDSDEFVVFTMATNAADKGGRCGRCGRVRCGP